MNILNSLQKNLQSQLGALFDLSAQDMPELELTLNADENKQQFGDLSSNIALILAKKVGSNPRAIAQKIQENLNHPAIAKVEIAGPGFINIYLNQESLSTLAQALYADVSGTVRPVLSEIEHYSVEFVSANPTGPLHVGHGRGGIIGDVLGNVLKFCGNNVTKEFYINDAGVQIAKLGISFKARCLQALGQEVEFPEDGYHGDYLKQLAARCVEQYGPAISTQPDHFFAHYAKEHLLEKIKETLSNYGINFDVWFSEKTLHDSGAIERALEKLNTTGYLYEAEGALWFKSTLFGDDKDRVVKKQTGELTYVAADIAYLENKIARGAQKLVMVLGQDHHSYVVRLKGIMQALGHNPENLTVILYQLVTLKESGEYVRLSKRAGRIISLEDIIQEVGKDVSRFFYLNRKADAHLEFDLDLALKHSDENPVYYIQYAYVRTMSMLEKASTLPEYASISERDLINLTPEEALLIKKIMALSSILQTIVRQHQTHLLTYYTLELAHAFHKFYAHHRVINQEDPVASRRRLALVTIIQQTLGLTLSLMGLESPEKM